MTYFLIILFLVIALCIPVGISEEKKKERQSREEQDKLLWKDYRYWMKELHKTDETYHKRLDEWIAFHDKYMHLGMPTYTVGYDNYKGWPWEAPRVVVPYDTIEAESNLNTKVNYARNGKIDFSLEHKLPNIIQTATFYKEARLAVFGGKKELSVEQLRFIKSKADVSIDSIIVTITTTDIENPTYSMIFPLDERDTVDELKAAFNAFKELKRTNKKIKAEPDDTDDKVGISI